MDRFRLRPITTKDGDVSAPWMSKSSGSLAIARPPEPDPGKPLSPLA
jgi:hypothetical protein